MVSRKCGLDSTRHLVSLQQLRTALLAVLAGVALAACGGGTETVSGTVIDTNGHLFAGRTVFISSGTFKQTVVTDANGAFSVANVPKPYNAIVVDTDGQFAIEYQGLSRADPTLTDFDTISSNRNATLAGQLVGGDYPEPPGYTTALAFSSPQALESFNFPTSASYSLLIQWGGPPTTTGTLYALQMHRDSGPAGLPLDYPGYGTLSGAVLQDGSTLGGQNISLGAVATDTLSGAVSLPAEYTVATKSLSLLVAPGVALSLANDFSVDSSFTYKTPSIPQTSLSVIATANSASGEYVGVQKTGLAANASGIALSAPAAPTLTLPADAATGVTLATPFSWSAYAGGVHILFVSSGGPGPTFLVFTTATTTTLSDLTSAGLSLPPSSAFGWELAGLGPVASVDDVAAQGLTQLFAGDYTEGISASRRFTTGP